MSRGRNKFARVGDEWLCAGCGAVAPAAQFGGLDHRGTRRRATCDQCFSPASAGRAYARATLAPGGGYLGRRKGAARADAAAGAAGAWVPLWRVEQAESRAACAEPPRPPDRPDLLPTALSVDYDEVPIG